MPILIDFETRSRVKIKTLGGRRYAESPSTEAISLVLYRTEDHRLEHWWYGDAPPTWAFGQPLAAHNADTFDRHIWELTQGWPAPPEWIDTSIAARRAGLPGALDALAQRWLGLEKDKAGNRFTLSLSQPSRAKATKGQLPALTDAVRARVQPYNASDVEVMAHGWERLLPWIDMSYCGEDDVLAVDRIINDRGVCFDRQLAARLLEEDTRNAEDALTAIGRELGWTADEVRACVSSSEQFAAATGLENMQAQTVEEALVNGAGRGLPAYVLALCRARQAIGSIASGKLRAGLARVSPDGRLRDMHKYYGAHTGRWSGVGMQLQNMPRPHNRYEKYVDADICRMADAVLAGGHATQDEIDLLLRACIFARPGHSLVFCDFSGVENRALMWAAGDTAAIEKILTPGFDSYKEMAGKIYGVDPATIGKDERRQVGKVGDLACGYQGGEDAINNFAVKMGIDLAAAGIDAKDIVAAWRSLHEPCVEFWRDLENGMARAVRDGVANRVSVFEFVPADDGSAVAMFLPSGRPVVYNDAQAHYSRGRVRVSYQGRIGRTSLYGGILAENAIQAMCRCLMARTLVQMECAGLDPVLHVHDEGVGEVPTPSVKEAGAELHRIMTSLPEWAPEFPVGAAGAEGKRYRK